MRSLRHDDSPSLKALKLLNFPGVFQKEHFTLGTEKLLMIYKKQKRKIIYSPGHTNLISIDN